MTDQYNYSGNEHQKSMLLQGEKIYLRALEPSDSELLYRWENDVDFWQASNTLAPFSLKIIKEFIDSVQDIYTTKQLRLMICLKENEKAIGTIDLFDFDPYNLRVGIGILIAEREERKKKYAAESLAIVIEYCFSLLRLKQVYCNISEDNTDSLNLFQKAGFESCGLKKAWLRKGNTWTNEFTLQLLNEEKDL